MKKGRRKKAITRKEKKQQRARKAREIDLIRAYYGGDFGAEVRKVADFLAREAHRAFTAYSEFESLAISLRIIAEKGTGLKERLG